MSDEDLMTIAEAQEYLGIGNKKMAALLKGELPFEYDKLDKRSKLVKRGDVERLKAQSKKASA